jgi:hypothetical protein
LFVDRAPAGVGRYAVVSVQWSNLLFAPHGGGWKRQELHNRGLVGPHYTLGIAWVATGQWIDMKSASDLGIHPVRAPKGSDLIVVARDVPFGNSVTGR